MIVYIIKNLSVALCQQCKQNFPLETKCVSFKLTSLCPIHAIFRSAISRLQDWKYITCMHVWPTETAMLIPKSIQTIFQQTFRFIDVLVFSSNCLSLTKYCPLSEMEHSDMNLAINETKQCPSTDNVFWNYSYMHIAQ
jgi:hypothetical protein